MSWSVPKLEFTRAPFFPRVAWSGSGRLISGTGRENGNDSYLPSSLVMIRADFTYYKDAWAGSHEFQAGFFGAPRNTYDQTSNFINDGFILEEVRQIDPNNPAGGNRSVSPPVPESDDAPDPRGAGAGLRALHSGFLEAPSPADA